MAGTFEGGKSAAKTNIERYGADFYKVAGGKGGKARVAKGFSMDKNRAKSAGAKGGKISKRKNANEELVVKLYRNGASRKEIALGLGVSYSTVWAIVDRYQKSKSPLARLAKKADEYIRGLNAR